MYVCIRLISADVDFFRIFGASQLRHHIFRKIDQDRSRLSGSCNVERFFDDPSQIRTIPDSHAVFGNASRDPDNIHFLKRIVPDQMSRYLSGKTNKRDTVIIRGCKPRHQISCSRTAGHKAYADFPGRPCISVRFMNKRLLMTR